MNIIVKSLTEKLAVLADTTRYDASCASPDTTRRNQIEGLFQSSGIIRSPDKTMEDKAQFARTLARDQQRRGIHYH